MKIITFHVVELSVYFRLTCKYRQKPATAYRLWNCHLEGIKESKNKIGQTIITVFPFFYVTTVRSYVPPTESVVGDKCSIIALSIQLLVNRRRRASNILFANGSGWILYRREINSTKKGVRLFPDVENMI